MEVESCYVNYMYRY